ncbi:solute carrier family 15 member 4-like [Mizuhopecten yessoensis]|uniref:Solute carrier family 15 member 4 n=1 Tax=Mizuhopecten yessoensis TaxID=6573 RepID=A0A210PV75_MIZYE|nr:solute carrier family 15 member 4-like [Mizuhopecten yessoensis]XP_021374557.1 solute carrier family 15 member 4-like [Mizuhopecten yessoensis]XP_021374558.1 solute carrier family 15 member 4-like [Mizuhopecten yessoensis]XP_021374559.1 solute carrier family 15 member 4-like [Mizuhopecten yessoensis]XP_021374560.1 solute carrier family 15 member 4-like [Mizuhopecten yessoensis]XP_021374561.1 solute carrier family 15 member 4-like [Mizuhopecten yessoensis]XP_021374562.1 solute carrier famil
MAQFDPDERNPLLSGSGGNQCLSSRVTLQEPLDNMAKPEMGIKENKSAFRGKTGLVVVCILMTELCERLTYYSVVANLVLFCTSKLDIPSSDAANISLIFSGTVYLIPVIGGYISDSYAGKYNTILGSGLIYLLGLFLLPAAAIDYSDWFGRDDEGVKYDLSIETRKAYFFLGLTFVAIGTGGIKANVGPYGAQQVTDLGPEAVQSFFNWFYWFINAGSLVAYSGVAYIQQNISFTIGFVIPLASMIVALIIFVAARNLYVNTAVGGSIFSKAFGVCCATKCKGFKKARIQNGGPYSNEMVDGVISVLRVLPVFLMIIMYWAVYSQMQSTFFLQSERMDVMVGDVKMPAAVLNIFNTVIILILIPIIDRVIYPLLAKYGRSPSHLQRIGLGMILAALSVVVAGVLEIYRKQELSESGGIMQELAGDQFNASTLSVFLQVPEFALVGASEVFASISGLEFAYSEAPDFMQGLVMGLFLMTSGIGNYVSSLILVIVKAASTSDPWFPDEINEGKAEYLFFLIGGLMVVNFLIFIIIAKAYKTRASEQSKNEKPELIDTDPNMDRKLKIDPGYHDNPLATDTRM